MGGGQATHNRTVVAAFHTALLHQGIIVLGIAFAVAVAWYALGVAQQRHAAAHPGRPPANAWPGEAPARRLLRVDFGVLWTVDGLLQLQAAMPLGMIPDVVEPAAASSPAWVRHLLVGPVQVWNYHPVTAATAAVWIQVGIGVWLLVAPRGRWSRLGGAASVAWGLIVWVFGEAFGGIFAPGLTWLFGAPGAALFYVAAGILVALPEGWWRGPRLGKVVLRVMGGFFAGMALLQAWPDRGFWQGHGRGRPAGLAQMVTQMAHTTQPKVLSRWLSAFARFDAAHGWAVNLFVVIALAAIGAALLVARPDVTRGAVGAAIVVCLADWVLVEDLGFLGGTGTDPNSMIPIALLVVAGYVALARPAAAPTTAPEGVPLTDAAGGWERLVANPGYTFRVIAALGAIGVTLVGAVPMALATTSPHGDPILAVAVDGHLAAGAVRADTDPGVWSSELLLAPNEKGESGHERAGRLADRTGYRLGRKLPPRSPGSQPGLKYLP